MSILNLSSPNTKRADAACGTARPKPLREGPAFMQVIFHNHCAQLAAALSGPVSLRRIRALQGLYYAVLVSLSCLKLTALGLN